MRIGQKFAVAACLVVLTGVASGILIFGFKSDSGKPPSQCPGFTPTSRASASADEAGKDLFRGIVFGQGAIACELGKRPSLAAFYSDQYSQNNTAGKIGRADTIINDIITGDPQYFAEFGGAVRSGNPFVVANALDGVEPRLRAENVSLDFAHSDQAPGGYIDTNFQFNFNFHTNVNAFFNENVGINVTIVRDGRSAPSAKRGFQRENMIADITATLRN
jgi:SdpC family antimicrobial peptide